MHALRSIIDGNSNFQAELVAYYNNPNKRIEGIDSFSIGGAKKRDIFITKKDHGPDVNKLANTLIERVNRLQYWLDSARMTTQKCQDLIVAWGDRTLSKDQMQYITQIHEEYHQFDEDDGIETPELIIYCDEYHREPLRKVIKTFEPYPEKVEELEIGRGPRFDNKGNLIMSTDDYFETERPWEGWYSFSGHVRPHPYKKNYELRWWAEHERFRDGVWETVRGHYKEVLVRV